MPRKIRQKIKPFKIAKFKCSRCKKETYLVSLLRREKESSYKYICPVCFIWLRKIYEKKLRKRSGNPLPERGK